MAVNEDLIVLDSSDPLNLIINNAAMDDADPNAAPPDWSQLGALWAEEQNGNNTSANTKEYDAYIDFNIPSNMLDMDFDMSLASTGNGIEPSALHLGGPDDRLGYPSFDDPFQFSASASPADILAAQFPFASHGGDTLADSSSSNTGLETPSTKPRRLSVTSSSSSSGPSFSPLPESIPSPSIGYTSDSSAVSPVTELAQRARQSAGVMLAVPISNGESTPFQADQLSPTASALQGKIQIQRLAATPPKSSTPSATSSAASTPPPSTPPTTIPTESSISAPPSAANVPRPKTSHTTIERRYRTNLNARIQSLRMAVPALRVLEDRDSGGSSKKIKKNLKTGVLIKSSSGAMPLGGDASLASTGLNPYGEVDVIDERGYVDGVKVARKCSKANVLGKAVEYIRVLKRREIRLRAEQDGLKALICGLVGGSALLKEWEREWRERFGGEERDEIPVDVSGEGDDEGEDDDDDDDDEEGEGTGKKRKRAKLERDLLPSPKRELKPASNVTMTLDGLPERRKRGRPRKTQPVPTPTSPATTASTPIDYQNQQQPQQYLLAVFALFSFFNSPLTSTSHYASGQDKGHVLSSPPVPLAYSPEIVSQFTPPSEMSTTAITWRDWLQIIHLVFTILLFVSVVARVGSRFGVAGLRRLVNPILGRSRKGDEEKEVEMIILGQAAVPPLVSALTLYRSLPLSSLPIVRALFLYRLGSSASASALIRPFFRARSRIIWASPGHGYKHKVIQSSSIEDIYAALPSITLNGERDLVGAIAAYLVRRRLGDVLGKWFVYEVNASALKDKKVVDESREDLKLLLCTANELGGEVAALARNVDRIHASLFKAPSITTTVPVVWKAVGPGGGEDETDASDVSSMTASIDSFDEDDDEDVEEDEEEAQVPSTILRALVLYRSLFSSSISSTTAGLAPPPPMISIEPPTPTAPNAIRRRTINSTTPSIVTSKNTLRTAFDRQKMYTLRRLLGSCVFEKHGEMMEDARDRVVDMLVDAERYSLQTRV